MDANKEVVRLFSDDESWAHLSQHSLGRLVTRVGDVLDIFPVNYVVDNGSIVFRTAEGSKLFEVTVNEDVLFEVDDYTDDDAWSVVVRGKASRLTSAADIAAADELPLRPWIPTLKYNYVRVNAASVSGRGFARGDEPDRYGIQPY